MSLIKILIHLNIFPSKYTLSGYFRVMYLAMREIKKLDVLNFAVVLGLVNAAIGFVLALLFLLGAGGMFSMMQASMMGFWLIGPLTLVVFPTVIFIYTFILGAVFALVYNFVARKYQGIKVELE